MTKKHERGVFVLIFAFLALSSGCPQEYSPKKKVEHLQGDREGDKRNGTGKAAGVNEEGEGVGSGPAPTEGAGGEKGCTMESIRKTMMTRRDAIQACYIQVIAKDPEIKGRISLQLGIQPGGKLVQRSVYESELPEAVGACLLQVIKDLQFPGEFEKVCGIIYPFVFSSNQSK